MTAAMKANLSKNRFSQYAYKPDRKKIVPFGLEVSAAPVLGEILQEDASLMESVTGLMAQAKAGGTIMSYENAVKKFKEFCAEKNYNYPKFTEKAVVHYIVQLDKDKASLATINQLKPALVLVEQLSGVQSSAFTDMADILLAAAKRRRQRASLRRRKPVSCRMISYTSCSRSVWRLVLKTRYQIQFF